MDGTEMIIDGVKNVFGGQEAVLVAVTYSYMFENCGVYVTIAARLEKRKRYVTTLWLLVSD